MRTLQNVFVAMPLLVLLVVEITLYPTLQEELLNNSSDLAISIELETLLTNERYLAVDDDRHVSIE